MKREPTGVLKELETLCLYTIGAILKIVTMYLLYNGPAS